MKKIWLILCCAASLTAMPAQIIVIRHAEKDPVTRGISEEGMGRAAALAYYLTQTDYLLQNGPIAAIFASRTVLMSDRRFPRTIETLMPLAQYLSMPIHIPYNGYQVTEMADLVLNNEKYDGKNILICWNHSSIHDLIAALGYRVPFTCNAPPPPPCPDPQKKYPDCRFDLVFVLTYPIAPGPAPYAPVYFQQLIFGDLTCEMPPYPPSLPPATCLCNDPVSCAQICSVCCSDVGLGDD